MKARKGYVPQESIYPINGLDTFDPSVVVDEHRSPNCFNMELIKGEVAKRQGYNYLGDALGDLVIGVVEFQDFSGTKHLLAFTVTSQFVYDSATNTWTDITGASTTWTGDETNQFDYVIASGKDGSGTYTTWIIATNGKDDPIYWDGTSTFDVFAPDIPSFASFKTIAQFNDHLFLGNVTTSGDLPTTLYWSQTQELTKFADGSLGGGAAILTDTQGEIQRLIQLGDRLMVYSDNTIHSITYVAGAAIFTFEKILQETRLLNSRSIVNLGPYHLFLSQENIIYFDGSKLWGHVGNRVYRAYRDELVAANRHMSFAFHDVAKFHVYFCYPIAGSTSQFYKVEYKLSNLPDSNWTRIKYIDRMTCAGFYSRDTNLTCDSDFLTGVKCSGLNLRCDQGSTKGAFPVRVFGTAGGKIALCDDTVPNDAGIAAESYWDTKDFNPPIEFQSSLARWIEVEMDLKGFEVEVWTSVDQGRTYQLVTNLNLTNDWQWFVVPIDLMSRTLRVRLRNSCPSSSFSFRDIKLWARPSGPTPTA